MLIADLTSTALTLLFIASSVLALLVLGQSWHGFAAQFRSLGDELRHTSEYREFSIMLTITEARQPLPRMRFNLRPKAAVYRSERKPALRAAA